ncbi:MAG TPA: histidine--tRNA ligase [Syntrophales bacterium]|jgi:histidyl-tRNA synthetase|nr:histidine--tRNA ligase [Syntrophales bacterium]HQA81942.1 histidine--tRNA ligase [Syntrophales bacterium]
MDAITVVKGFKDILPEEAFNWQRVEQFARTIFADFGFKEIRVPILEKTELFTRGIGDTTDIVEKEMYTFSDRGTESLTLRPEATASVLRAYIEHNLFSQNAVLRLFTIGPMFRRERPQKGRYRQFHQIDVEVLGSDDPRIDAELMIMLVRFLNGLGLDNLNLDINSLGCSACRSTFREKVIAFLKDTQDDLCEDCRRRLHTNPLRVFDCKNETCGQIIKDAPSILDFICDDCRNHFEKVRSSLESFELPYRINHRMVRGLDYYTRTTFEVTIPQMGSQNAVVGGGRYDGLVRDLGGPDISGIGFAIGFERLMALLPPEQTAVPPAPALFIAALGNQAREVAFRLCNRLRLKGIPTEMDYEGKSLKSQMKKADKLGSRYVLILGDREIETGQGELRDMRSSTQQAVPLDQVENHIIQLEK